MRFSFNQSCYLGFSISLSYFVIYNYYSHLFINWLGLITKETYEIIPGCPYIITASTLIQLLHECAREIKLIH